MEKIGAKNKKKKNVKNRKKEIFGWKKYSIGFHRNNLYIRTC